MRGFANDLWADLREKRLWPVALLLVLAAVAAPMVLARGGADTPPPLPAPAPTASGLAAPPEAQEVSLDGTPVEAAPDGRYKDPFAGARSAQAAATVAPAPAAPSPAPSVALSPGSSSSPSFSSSPTSSPSPSPAAGGPSAAPRPSRGAAPSSPRSSGEFAGYRVDVHWGRAGSAKRLRDVVRLGRLDAGDEPLLLYFGVRHGGDSALFLLTTRAQAVGDGRCMPSPRSCQVIEMRKGDAHFFDVETANGGLVQYELDLDRIVKRYADTSAEARELRRRESKRGRQLMYDAIERGRDYSTAFMYKSRLGAIVRDVKATTSWFRSSAGPEDVPPAE